MRGKPWSAEEERHLRELVAEGKGLDEIAQAMNRSRIAVRAKLFNLGLSLSRVRGAFGLAQSGVVRRFEAAQPVAHHREAESLGCRVSCVRHRA